jgi:maltose-binding protein MalE
MDFTRIQTCGSYILEFKVVNTGPKTLQAYTIVAKDLVAHSQQTTSSTTFDFVNGCFIQQEIGWIDPGKVGYVYANNFSYDPTGHSFEATVAICTHNDMTGVCATQAIKFTP